MAWEAQPQCGTKPWAQCRRGGMAAPTGQHQNLFSVPFSFKHKVTARAASKACLAAAENSSSGVRGPRLVRLFRPQIQACRRSEDRPSSPNGRIPVPAHCNRRARGMACASDHGVAPSPSRCTSAAMHCLGAHQSDAAKVCSAVAPGPATQIQASARDFRLVLPPEPRAPPWA